MQALSIVLIQLELDDATNSLVTLYPQGTIEAVQLISAPQIQCKNEWLPKLTETNFLN